MDPTSVFYDSRGPGKPGLEEIKREPHTGADLRGKLRQKSCWDDRVAIVVESAEVDMGDSPADLTIRQVAVKATCCSCHGHYPKGCTWCRFSELTKMF